MSTIPETSSQQSSSILYLPTELKFQIISYLRPIDGINLARTCRAFGFWTAQEVLRVNCRSGARKALFHACSSDDVALAERALDCGASANDPIGGHLDGPRRPNYITLPAPFSRLLLSLQVQWVNQEQAQWVKKQLCRAAEGESVFFSALDCAIRRGASCPLIRVLIDKGRLTTCTLNRGGEYLGVNPFLTPLQSVNMVRLPGEWDREGEWKTLPVELAVLEDAVNIAILLINSGADVTLQPPARDVISWSRFGLDNLRRSIFSIAVAFYPVSPDIVEPLLRLILEKGACLGLQRRKFIQILHSPAHPYYECYNSRLKPLLTEYGVLRCPEDSRPV